MNCRLRMMALALAAGLGLTIVPAGTAFASRAGRRNTAIGLGALAVYGVATKKPLVAGLAGGGAVYSYMRSRQGRHHRRRRVVRRRVVHHHYRHR
jgi:hypothetical protein